MKRKRFITRVILLLLLVTGCLTFRSIQAAEENSVEFTFEFPQKEEGAYDYNDQLEGDLVFDLYYIAPIKWDGAGDGTETSTKYYIPYEDIVDTYQRLFDRFVDGRVDNKHSINVSERETTVGSGVYELVNDELKKYTLPELANDLARIIYSGPITPDTNNKDITNIPFGENDVVPEDGLYLAFVHVAGDSDYLKQRIDKVPVEGSETYTDKDVYYTAVNSIYHEYDFNPLLVFLKSTDRETVLKGAPKYEENYRYDDLLIIKELTSIGGKGLEEDTFSFEPVTFVYEIKAYDPKDSTKVIYQDVASITISSDEQLIGQTIAERIPVGARVEVTEIYDRSYTLDETEKTLKETIIVSERDDDGEHLTDPETDLYLYQNNEEKIFAYTYFKNKFDFDPLEGYGIDNMYRYGSDGWFYDGDKACDMDET